MLLNFDFDGVISDSLPQLMTVMTKAQKIVGKGRCPEEEDLFQMETLTFESVAEKIGIPPQSTARFLSLVYEFQRKETRAAPLFPGIRKTLRRLAESHTIHIITASQTQIVEKTLSVYGMDLAVHKVLGGESGENKAERILRGISEHNGHPRTAVMIGDAVSDIHEGKKAGVLTIAVTWGIHSREMLLKEGPDKIARTPAHLLEIIDGLSAAAPPVY